MALGRGREGARPVCKEELQNPGEGAGWGWGYNYQGHSAADGKVPRVPMDPSSHR